MIKEIKQFAGEYSLKNLKKMEGRDGYIWSATIYRNGVKIGDCLDYGNGGPVSFHLPSNEIKDLTDYAKLKISGDFEQAEFFLTILADYEESLKKLVSASKTKTLFMVGNEKVDEYGIPMEYSIIKAPFDENVRAQIVDKYKATRILNEEVAQLNNKNKVKKPKMK